MPITQLSLFVENRPGELGKVCRVLKDNGVNISTLSLADTQQFGILRLLVKETDKARKVLENAGYVVKSTDVLAITVPDYPGGLADVLSILDKYSFQVEYMYAFTFGRGDRAVIVFRFENPERAVEALRNEPVELLRADDLFK